MRLLSYCVLLLGLLVLSLEHHSCSSSLGEEEDSNGTSSSGGNASRDLPEYTIDRTSDLIGLVVYFESLYYDQNWLVPWNYGLPHYTGTVNPVDEEDVFDPYEKVQMKGTIASAYTEHVIIPCPYCVCLFVSLSSC